MRFDEYTVLFVEYAMRFDASAAGFAPPYYCRGRLPAWERAKLRERFPVPMPHQTPSSNQYRTYRDLPPLAGLCSFSEAQVQGLSVAECVRRLKRYHYGFKRL